MFIHANKNSVAHQEKTSTIDNLKPQVTCGETVESPRETVTDISLTI